jgi:hypothetical protein
MNWRLAVKGLWETQMDMEQTLNNFKAKKESTLGKNLPWGLLQPPQHKLKPTFPFLPFTETAQENMIK